MGFAAVGTAGGFPGTYHGALAAAAATDNVVGASAWVVKTGGQTINSMVQTGNLTFAAASDTLKIDSGMLTQNAQTSPLLGTASVRGQLTSGLGTGELFLIRTNEGSGGAAGALQIHSVIIDNSVVTMQGGAQQIAASNIVTLNGGATLTMVGANNTLAGLVFNSHGGKTTPTVTGGTKLTLTGDLTATPTDPSVTPLISVVLDLNGSAAHDITVAALPEGNVINNRTQLNGLTISAVIQNGGFTKKGNGVLTLTGTNTYTGDTVVQEGILSLTKASLADASIIRIGTAPGAAAVLKLDHTLTDTVANLFIDGVPMPAGTYGSSTSTATNKDDATFAGSGVLKVTSGTPVTDPFNLWAQTHITALNPSANTTPGGDPDIDGASNLAEFAFNGNPLSAADHGKVFVLTADSDDVGTARELILTVAVRAGTPVFSADTSPKASHDGITYTIEGSTTLNGFPGKVNVVSPVTTGLPAAGTGYEYRSFSLNNSNGLPTTGFLRAKVTQ